MSNSQSDSSVFSVRIVSIDHYMAPPIPDFDICYSSFQGGKVNEVPVLRIYGSTPAGQKTCLHIHRALPYLYVPLADLLPQSTPTHQEDDACTHALAIALEKALKLKGGSGSKQQHVHGCSLVRAKKFYGAVLDKILQPHESHIPFILQFLVDYNLYGMGYLHLLRMKFRNPVPDLFHPRKFNCHGQHGQKREDFTLDSSGFQTSSDVKMVQSLIPIWEEEYKRTGMHETALLSDLDKPLPEDVLKALSLGLGFDDKLMDLCCKVEEHLPHNDLGFEHPVLPAANEQNLVGYTHISSKQALSCLKEPNLLGSLSQHCKPREKEMAAALSEGKDVCPVLLSVGGVQSSETVLPSDPKATDTEVLGLLRWLAASHAAEDINSDDELVRESILTPLLPATTIDKVLEKASIDYESESQKECQDILDSVEDLISFEDLKERTYHSFDPTQVSSGKNIPQTDGSSDDLSLSPSAGSVSNASKRDIKAEHKKSSQDGGKTFSNKQKRKNSLWGSLPLSVTEKEQGSLDSVDLNITETCADEIKEYLGTSFSAENNFGKTSNPLNINLQANDCNKQEASTLVECSVRDLMRKREVAELIPLIVDLLGARIEALPEKCDSAISIGPCETYNDKKFDFQATAAEPIISNAYASESHTEIVSPDERMQQTGVSGSWCFSASLIDKSDLHNEDCGGGQHGRNTGLVVGSEEKTVELIGMTFCKRLLPADWNEGATGNVPPFREGNYHVTSGRTMDEILPFFSQDREEDKENQNNFVGNNSCKSQEAALGVPTHYQNDGSLLYQLTPVFSPPSVDSVYGWMSCVDKGTSKQSNELSAESPTLTGSSKCLVASENSSPVNHKESLTETTSKYHMESVSDQGLPEKNLVLGSDVNSCCDESKCQSEGKITNINTCTAGSQDMSQISGPDGKSMPTPLSQIGFRDPASVGAGQQLTLLSLEVHTESRGDLRPDPDLMLNAGLCQSRDGISGFKVFIFDEEKHLFGQFMDILCSLDPDILMGWDIQGCSLGFLAERASYLGIRLLNKISRTPSETKIKAEEINTSEKGLEDELLLHPLVADIVVTEDAIIEDEWGRTHASGVHVGGRIVLNVWRLMRSEVTLNMYTAEAVAESVLRRKIPAIPCKVLKNGIQVVVHKQELARVFGIDFFSVLSRGSQFRVESMFLRLAHTQNYLAISPGNQQVAHQPAMECLPLVMEPESGFYADPVVVLDFQSLYPSMIIAYNLCFCTCLGKIANSEVNTLGVNSYAPDPNVLRDLKDQLLLTPNGVMYVPSKVRKGVLPRLLEEILSTRIMVKQAMKNLTPTQQVLQRIFNARQLALKLIANVTYGYTAAGFSGRMPCAELADSIVQCGRSTLEKAISYVNAHEKWKANVIYGDTDSMFVLLEGRNVEESFKIGREIATAITAMNPYPVTLKMEKVYHPCFLLTKKRYVGYSYVSSDQAKPIFDAKGTETVRRDSCGAVAKTLEQSLRLFFEHQDISKVRAYLHRQWTRILSGRVSLQDFVFAKEVRLGTYSTKVGSVPPAAIVATKAMRTDPRAEPRYAERVPYVVIHGEPGARLVDMVVDPLELLAINSPYRLNDLWFLEMPRPAREAFGKCGVHALNPQRMRIDHYYLSKHCMLCGELVQLSAHLCSKCSQNETAAAAAITGRTSKLEGEMQHLAAICRHCGGGDWVVESG
ncbi:DNA polymerase zeta catalytic subunit [Hibiscus syriacus]|uniref:DNA polymerase n=1 Tax=Hibiscus syriacus TaxID=106335 RepID=A0A6A2XHU5_HIBSY|nr:DNA polymerase zeta catalytic subunit [Hibiscus syriacus]